MQILVSKEEKVNSLSAPSVEGGFSLIEMLLVLTVVAILLTVAVLVIPNHDERNWQNNLDQLVASLNAAQDESQITANMLQNIPVTLSVQVGSAVLKIHDLLRLAQGSVVELDRIAGEPVDLLVNNTVVAQGEVVTVNERYGIRLTRVVTAAERIRNI
jgi:flagellar motor switch protein FliN/FliY